MYHKKWLRKPQLKAESSSCNKYTKLETPTPTGACESVYSVKYCNESELNANLGMWLVLSCCGAYLIPGGAAVGVAKPVQNLTEGPDGPVLS